MSYVILGFGANICGKYGEPINSITSAIKELKEMQVEFLKISSIYSSRAVGAPYQPDFYNLVALCNCTLHPNKLLKAIKQLESDAGRSGSLFWGPRPLDIDIIDFKSNIINWPKLKKNKAGLKRYGSAKTSLLSLPHKEMHKRVFVLVPLKEVAEDWRHPVLGKTPDILLKQYCSPLEVKSLEKLDISLDL